MTQSRRPIHPPSVGKLFDEMLVVMARSGDRRAADRLFSRWDTRLLRAARRYCGSDDAARDLTQDCWLGIWKGLGSLREPSRFRSFAFAVLHRRGAEHLRRVVRDRNALSQDTEPPEGALKPAQSEHAAINQAFAKLPPDQRLAAHLHFVEGLTLSEIAEVQSIPEGTAKSRLFHARRKLKAALTQPE